MNDGSRVPPLRQVPTLTEVVAEDWGDDQPLVPGGTDEEAVALDAQDGWLAEPAELPLDGPLWDRAAEQQLVERVLADVQRQIDPVLEQRLREMLASVLARWSEALVEDSRERLASVLRDVVEQAVAREFERQRRR